MFKREQEGAKKLAFETIADDEHLPVFFDKLEN